jgi:hypothetical protein
VAEGKGRQRGSERPAAARPRGQSPHQGGHRGEAHREPAQREPTQRGGLLGWLQLPLFRVRPAPPAPPPPAPPRPLRVRLAGVEVRLPGAVAGQVSEAAARSLARRLAARLPFPLVELVLTENRTILLTTTRTTTGGLQMRLHRAFVEAGEEALPAVVAFAGGSRGRRRSEALAALRAHVEAWRAAGNDAGRPPHIEARGAIHDLTAIRDAINARMFGGRLAPAITWGRWAYLGRRRRTIRLGSYDEGLRLIRIHPALDQAWVPRHFVASVVFHEMLHALLPAKEGGGRRCLHGPEFRRRERELPGYAAAEAWLSSNLHRLLRSRPAPAAQPAPRRTAPASRPPRTAARPLAPAARPRRERRGRDGARER